MKRIFGMIMLFVVLCVIFYVVAGKDNDNISNVINSEGQAESNESTADIDYKQDSEYLKGVWFSYLDWNLLFQGKSESDFIVKVEAVIDNAISINCNTIFLHVRAFGDAMYSSEYFPWSKSCTGQIGQDPGYDPLKIIIEKAHEKNVAIHAWINPMRTMTEKEFSQIDNSYLIKQWYNEQSDQYFMVDDTGHYILIPGNPEVRELIANGAAELAANYDIDGIHMDDYFYPSGVDELEHNDISYYEKQNHSESIEQWRRDSVTSMMAEVYQAVKKENPDIVVGVSPQSSLTANYEKLFADVESWVTDGEVIDYVVPQIYFGFNNSSQPFTEAAEQWNSLMDNSRVKLYVGLACYKIGLEDDVNAGTGNTEWIEAFNSTNDILKRQVQCLEELSNCSGYCFYDYKSLFNVDGTTKQTIIKELENLMNAEE